jgi:hypothetical protein
LQNELAYFAIIVNYMFMKNDILGQCYKTFYSYSYEFLQ